MKNITTSIVVALTLGVCASSVSAASPDPRAQKAGTYYSQGMTAMKVRKYDIAKANFNQVLKIYPNHPQAKRQLIYISSNRKSLDVNTRKGSLHQVIIPKVDIEQLSLQEALDVFSVLVDQASGKKVSPNILVKDPAQKFNGRSVTLTLNKVPADTLLKYILDQTSGIAAYDKHAIVVSPRQQTGGKE